MSPSRLWLQDFIAAAPSPPVAAGRVDEAVADASLADYEAGRLAMESGDFERGAVLLAQSFERWPHAMALELRGICHIRLGRVGAAAADFAGALALKRHVRPASMLAACFVALGLDSDAVTPCAIALRLDPKNRLALQVWEELARRLMESGKDTCPVAFD